MTLRTILDDAERRRKSLVYYAPEAGDFGDQFEARNVEVTHREIPASGPDPFVAIREGGEFRGAITLDALREFIRRPRLSGGDRPTPSDEYRAILELLDDTVFASLRRRQLLLTSREFEDRAWRVGRGTLHVGFQSVERFLPQLTLYRRLADETDLDIHVYLVPDDGETLPDAAVTYHTEPADEIGRYWFMAFDGGGSPEQRFALVAEQRDDDTFYGVWTYDESLVDRTLDLIPSVGGGAGGDATGEAARDEEESGDERERSGDGGRRDGGRENPGGDRP